MKKMLFTAALAAALTMFFSVTAYAVSAKFDTSKAENGIVTITLSNVGSEIIGAHVQKGNDQKNAYQYRKINNVTSLPLQMGPGEYTIRVLRLVEGNTYKPVEAIKIDVKTIDEKAMFTSSNLHVDFAASKTAIPTLAKLSDGKTKDADKAAPVYEEIVKTFKYDNDLAAKILAKTVTMYVPVIDPVFDAKKGICYDYAAVLGGALRNLGIPTKMVFGIVPELTNKDGTYVEHAWNEVLIDGKWLRVDATFDTSEFLAGRKFSMTTRKSSETTILKTF